MQTYTGSRFTDDKPVATTVYTTVYNNELTKRTTEYVSSAATKAGLPESKLPDLLTAASAGAAKLSESFSPAVASAASAALNDAYCRAIL